jgi:hypothetical protein
VAPPSSSSSPRTHRIERAEHFACSRAARSIVTTSPT